MNREELNQLLPDLVDGNVSDEVRADAEATLPFYPELQQDLEVARQIRTLLVTLQAENPELRVPAGFEARLLARVRQQSSRFELLDLSSTTFAAWVVEFINLLGGLLVPLSTPGTTQSSRV